MPDLVTTRESRSDEGDLMARPTVNYTDPAGAPSFYPAGQVVGGNAHRRPAHDPVAPRLMCRDLVPAGAAMTVVLTGTVWLWTHYGATVFFETVRGGLVACFG